MGTGVAVAVDLLVEILNNASKIGQLIQTIQAEGRTTLTDAEWQVVVGGDNSAEAALTAAIVKAKAAGK